MTDYFVVYNKILNETIPDFSDYIFNFDSNFDKLGISSMDRIESIHQLLCVLNLNIPMISFAGKATIMEILAVLPSDH